MSIIRFKDERSGIVGSARMLVLTGGLDDSVPVRLGSVVVLASVMNSSFQHIGLDLFYI